MLRLCVCLYGGGGGQKFDGEKRRKQKERKHASKQASKRNNIPSRAQRHHTHTYAHTYFRCTGVPVWLRGVWGGFSEPACSIPYISCHSLLGFDSFFLVLVSVFFSSFCWFIAFPRFQGSLEGILAVAFFFFFCPSFFDFFQGREEGGLLLTCLVRHPSCIHPSLLLHI